MKLKKALSGALLAAAFLGAAACSAQPMATPVPIPVESMTPSKEANPSTSLPASKKPATCQGYVGMTFDDGPTELTDQYLSVLQHYDVHATFFNLGKYENDRPRETLHIVQAGHVLANHTQTHPDMNKLTKEERAKEFSEPIHVNELLGHGKFEFWRPPYGSTSPEIRREGEALGMTEVLWEKDSKDFETTDPKKIIEKSRGMNDGDILLMHDGKPQTLAALPGIINEYYERGLCWGKLVRVDQERKTDVGTTHVVRAVKP